MRFEGVWEGELAELPPPSRWRSVAGATATRSTPRPRWPPHADVVRVARPARRLARLERPSRWPAACRPSLVAADAPDGPRGPPESAPGVATVVTHSIVLQYLSPEDGAVPGRGGGSRCPGHGGAPLAWLRMEPAGERAELRLTTWPHGEERVLATAGYHGRPVWWATPDSG